MPRVLTEQELDPVTEEVNQALDLIEEQQQRPNWRPPQAYPDLSAGGIIHDRGHDVRVTPMADGRKLDQGRPTVRQGWSWNGSESLLPLAWNPEGTRHDGARHYLRKRHCLCCQRSGFSRATCPQCAKNSCARCQGGADRTTENVLGNGKRIQGWIIPNFYLRQDDVPFPANFYGPIDCFLPFCPRRDGKGFKDQEQMIMHASTRHRLEWQAHLQSTRAREQSELETLRAQVAALTVAQLRQAGQAVAQAEVPQEQKLPLYVSDKPASPTRAKRHGIHKKKR